MLIAIKKPFAREIFNGEKRYELRKRKPSIQQGGIGVIYEPSPVKAATGCFRVEAVMRAPKQKLWTQTKGANGIEWSTFDQYFEGYPTGVAIKIRDVHHFEQYITLEELREKLSLFPPQTFTYLGHDQLNHIFKLAEGNSYVSSERI